MIISKLIFGSAPKRVEIRPEPNYSDFEDNNGTITKKYSDITSDENLNWRDKYKKYNDAINDPEQYQKEKFERAKKIKYAFINTDNITKKRESLEEMFKTKPSNRFNGVYSEGDSINSDIKELKFKGFADRPDMKQT